MTPDPTLADEKWARIAAEYGGCMVWDRDGAGTDADELPVCPGLQRAIMGWGAWLDCDDESNLPPHGRDPALKFDADLHREIGLLLAHAVKAQLPDWTIMFGWPLEQIEIALPRPGHR